TCRATCGSGCKTPSRLLPARPRKTPSSVFQVTQVEPCAVCHGVDGHGTAPLFPNLAAQQVEYLALQMELFRSGERPSHIMNTLTRTMSDKDIKIAVEYYAGLPNCK
ncbi:MAG: c-type cytochrome, partial [Pseudomonadota bacterium]